MTAGAYREIQLTQGLVALVDAADFDWLNQTKWYANRSGHTAYARCAVTGRMMHRLIIAAPVGAQVDHRDHNGLNNTRGNLRLCNATLNQANRRYAPSASGFRGVEMRGSKYRVSIKKDGDRLTFGRFLTAEDAARAYDSIALEKFGEFALLNFPAAA